MINLNKRKLLKMYFIVGKHIAKEKHMRLPLQESKLLETEFHRLKVMLTEPIKY